MLSLFLFSRHHDAKAVVAKPLHAIGDGSILERGRVVAPLRERKASGRDGRLRPREPDARGNG